MRELVPVNASFHQDAYSEHYYKWMEQKSERYKEYRRQWIENPKGFIKTDAPLDIDIETSSACNLRCPMCFRTAAEEGQVANSVRKQEHMDFELYKRVIDEAAELGVCAIKLNWMGEPLSTPS